MITLQDGERTSYKTSALQDGDRTSYKMIALQALRSLNFLIVERYESVRTSYKTSALQDGDRTSYKMIALQALRSLNFFIVGQYESEIALQEHIWVGVVPSPRSINVANKIVLRNAPYTRRRSHFITWFCALAVEGRTLQDDYKISTRFQL